MDNSRIKQNDLLGVNKMGKNIKKSPLHQPNFGSNPCTQQPQPLVYNINKNDFRNLVQQLTGSSEEPRPPQNPPKPQSVRLQRIRPPPLTPINPPRIPPVPMTQPQISCNNGLIRPAQYEQSSLTFHRNLPQSTPADSFWPNTAESPISAYVRYLKSSATDLSSKEIQTQTVPQAQDSVQIQAQVAESGFLNGPVPHLPDFTPLVSSPAGLPSPTPQFQLPSPSGYLNFLSPGSPYPLLSPGIPFSPLLTPNFSSSLMAHPGPHPPPSPDLISPSGLFPY